MTGRLRTVWALGLVVGAIAALLVPVVAQPAAAVVPPTERSDVAGGDGDAAGELAALHTPLLRVQQQLVACGPGEPYRVMAVDALFGREGVVLRTPAGTVKAPTEAELADSAGDWYLDIPGNALSPGCSYEQLFDQWRTPPVIYAHVFSDPDDPATLVLQYWFFYLYNDWNDRHEGDWEMIQLFFDAPDARSAIGTEPRLVAFAQHEGAEVSDWSDDVLQVVDGTRPVVYVAAGSHASYFQAERWFGKSAQSGFGCDDTRAPSEDVSPDVIMLDDEALPTWAGFQGRWGEKQPSFNNGPTGPNMKTQWTNPVRWVDEEGRRGAANLPAEGTKVTDAFCAVASYASQFLFRLLQEPLLTGTFLVCLLVVVTVLLRRTRWRPVFTRPVRARRAGGQIIRAAVSTVRRRPLLYMRIGALLPLAGLLATIIQTVVLRFTELGDVADVADRGSASGSIGALLLGSLFIGPATATVSVAAMIATLRIDADEPVSWRIVVAEVWRRRRTVLFSLLLTASLAGLAASTVLLPLGLVLLAMWAVAVPAALVDSAPLWLSRRLTRRRRLRSLVLGGAAFTLATVVPAACGVLALLVTDWSFAVVNLIDGVVGLLLVPTAGIISLLQFGDLRERLGYGTLPD
ncbi:MAG: hypothetical protein WCP59_00285 [Actinomycetota bacterium]